MCDDNATVAQAARGAAATPVAKMPGLPLSSLHSAHTVPSRPTRSPTRPQGSFILRHIAGGPRSVLADQPEALGLHRINDHEHHHRRCPSPNSSPGMAEAIRHIQVQLLPSRCGDAAGHSGRPFRTRPGRRSRCAGQGEAYAGSDAEPFGQGCGVTYTRRPPLNLQELTTRGQEDRRAERGLAEPEAFPHPTHYAVYRQAYDEAEEAAAVSLERNPRGAMESTMKPTSDWRSLIKVHPAAEMFPELEGDEFRSLAKDIHQQGLKTAIHTWFDEDEQEWRLDGRNRLNVMEELGYRFQIVKTGGIGSAKPHLRITEPLSNKTVYVVHHFAHGRDATEPYNYVTSLNIHRRHLTTAQKSELIATLLKADPAKSDRAVAEAAKVDHKTVGAKRAALKATGEIPQSDTTRVGADGKTRKLPAKPAKAQSKGQEEKIQALLEEKGVNTIQDLMTAPRQPEPKTETASEARLRKAYNASNERTIAEGLNAKWDLDKPPSLGWAQAVVKALTTEDFEAFKAWFRDFTGVSKHAAE